jgi:hypothetical protein
MNHHDEDIQLFHEHFARCGTVLCLQNSEASDDFCRDCRLEGEEEAGDPDHDDAERRHR